MYSRPKTAVVLLLMCIATLANPSISDAFASASIEGIFLFSLCMIGLCCCGPVLILIGLHTLGGVLLFINVLGLVELYMMLPLSMELRPTDGAAGVVLIGLTFLLAGFLCYVISQFIRN